MVGTLDLKVPTPAPTASPTPGCPASDLRMVALFDDSCTRDCVTEANHERFPPCQPGQPQYGVACQSALCFSYLSNFTKGGVECFAKEFDIETAGEGQHVPDLLRAALALLPRVAEAALAKVRVQFPALVINEDVAQVDDVLVLEIRLAEP